MIKTYDNVFKYSTLTDNAVQNFDVARSIYANMKMSVYVLARIMKIWNNEYDTANVKPLPASNSKVIHQISFEYTFDLSCIIEKAEKKQYKHAQ